MKMTPDRQAKYGPEHGLGRGLAYDRLRSEWQAAGRSVPGATWRGVVQQPQRSSLEARGGDTGVLQAAKQHFGWRVVD